MKANNKKPSIADQLMDGVKYNQVKRFNIKSIDCLAVKYRMAIKEVSDERNNGDGWWIYLIEPYFNHDLETSFIHEQKLSDCISILKNIVKKKIFEEWDNKWRCHARRETLEWSIYSSRK